MNVVEEARLLLIYFDRCASTFNPASYRSRLKQGTLALAENRTPRTRSSCVVPLIGKSISAALVLNKENVSYVFPLFE